ncbi:MAG: NAD-dependent epimerase/dehydratase family protein [Acidobacteriota bacterium]|nr:NAD-dependent epimerase/dehydratase family protein [Acidobacteriota bacterium]
MKILISGGNGYVGRELSRLAVNEHELCILDSLHYGYNRFDEAERDRFRLEQVNLTDNAAVARVINDFQPQVIINLAAIHYIPECEETPSIAVATNVSGTVNLLANAPRGCRFVFASSGAVYAPAEGPHGEETSEIAPQDIYGWTKLQGEQYLRYLVARRGLSGVIIRLFNVIGPGETNPHILPEIIAQLKSGRRTLQLGNIEPRRDYIDVSDAARGFLRAATIGEMDEGEVRVANLGTQRQYSVRELLDRLRAVTGAEFDIELDRARLRASDRPSLLADRTRMAEWFDWTPGYEIDQTLERTWAQPDLPRSLIQKYPPAE